MGIKLTNNAFATLAASINSSATSITLTTGQGARFPTLSAGDYFYATLIDTSNNLEIVKCTARSTDVLTVVRGQESTTARAYNTGDRIEIRVTAQTFLDATALTPAAVSDQDNTSTGYFDLPVGTTAQRPGTPTVGMLRYNSTLNQYEFYTTSGWLPIGGQSYSVEYIIVAGGGGGAELFGAGGAGGVLTGSYTVAAATNYSFTVGAGGAGAPTTIEGIGVVGSNSTGFSLTANGGGYGGAKVNGGSGGSGGGGGGWGGVAYTGGAGTAGQGNTGGNGTAVYDGAGGGGGGAGAVGGTASLKQAGNGGNGVIWPSGGATYYGGGGGGSCWQGSTSGVGTNGTGGLGGGGIGGGSTGALNAVGQAGTANTGGGGGAGVRNQNSTSYGGGAGGSGVVIIRYAGAQKGSGGTVTSSGGYTYHTFTSSGTFTA